MAQPDEVALVPDVGPEHARGDFVGPGLQLELLARPEVVEGLLLAELGDEGEGGHVPALQLAHYLVEVVSLLELNDSVLQVLQFAQGVGEYPCVNLAFVALVVELEGGGGACGVSPDLHLDDLGSLGGAQF